MQPIPLKDAGNVLSLGTMHTESGHVNINYRLYLRRVCLGLCCILSLATVGLTLVDVFNFYHNVKHEAAIPMSIAIPFFGFPLYVGMIALTWILTPIGSPYRKLLRGIVAMPYALALLLMIVYLGIM